MFSFEKTSEFCDEEWNTNIIPSLSKFIEIPNTSPHFNKEWAKTSHVDDAVDHIVTWVRNQNVTGLSMEVIRLNELTPLIYMEVESQLANKDDTILMYGHLDKQPPMADAWEEGLGPYTPVIRDGKLYGRGGADDGYAVYAAITSLKALQLQGIPHGRTIIIIEASEESGSQDLSHYIDHLRKQMGIPSLVICLDSGIESYDRLWVTSSLRGCIIGTLSVKVLDEGVHSGEAGGVVPSSFRILRHILSRLEDVESGEILPEFLKCDIPDYRVEQAKATGNVLGETIYTKLPFTGKTQPMTTIVTELILNNGFRAQLETTGVDGLPTITRAGNVLRSYSTFMLSLRLPPSVNSDVAAKGVKELLESDPPYGASVEFKFRGGANGWECPKLDDWLEETMQECSEKYWKKSCCNSFGGGTIPLMKTLGDMFPKSQFLVVGLLGPNSNAHGPNEFLHIEYGKKLTATISNVVYKHSKTIN